MAWFYCKPHKHHFERKALDGPWCPDCEAEAQKAKEEQLRYEQQQAKDMEDN